MLFARSDKSNALNKFLLFSFFRCVLYLSSPIIFIHRYRCTTQISSWHLGNRPSFPANEKKRTIIYNGWSSLIIRAQKDDDDGTKCTVAMCLIFICLTKSGSIKGIEIRYGSQRIPAGPPHLKLINILEGVLAFLTDKSISTLSLNSQQLSQLECKNIIYLLPQSTCGSIFLW